MQAQQFLAFIPQLFELVIISQFWAEQVHNGIAQIDHQPAIARITFDVDGVVKFLLDVILYCHCQRVEHAVAGTVAEDEIISKTRNFVNVEQEDLFGFFVFQY